MTLNPEEARRLHVLTLLESGQTTPAQAREALEFSARKRRWAPGRLARPTVWRRPAGGGGYFH